MQYFGYLRRNPNDAPEPGLNFDGYQLLVGQAESIQRQLRQRRDGESVHHLRRVSPTLWSVTGVLKLITQV